ncbi:MAG: CDP-alcohol phosphatidyltransferase family protein [Anaerolineae bacterium]
MVSLNSDGSPSFKAPGEVLRHATRGLMGRLGVIGARLGFNPDLITLIGLLIVAIAAVFAALGQFFVAGVILILGTPLDALDGAIARARSQPTRFGALLDSTLDRYADGLIFGGIAVYYAQRSDLSGLLLALTALIGAYGVSYVRARAEGLGIGSIKDGLFDRAARIIVLILALVTGYVLLGLVILSIGSHLTAVQRLRLAYRATRNDS